MGLVVEIAGIGSGVSSFLAKKGGGTFLMGPAGALGATVTGAATVVLAASAA